MGRLKVSNFVGLTPESGQYKNVSLHNFAVRRINIAPALIDTTFDEKVRDSVIDGSLDSIGLDFDIFKWKKKQIYGYILGIFQKEKLVELLNVSEEEFFGFIIDIDRGYFDNPYHSFYHCVDVFHIVYYCLSTLEAGKWMTKLDMLAILIGALCHDIAHPGVNNLYQVHAKTKLAIMYNDNSVLENYSCSLTFNLAAKHSVFRNLSRNDYRSLRTTIIQGILATDMSCHFDLLDRFQQFYKNFNPDPEHQLTIEQRRLILNVILHAADISNPCRPWDLCKIWSDFVVEEFYLQGDLEKLNGLPISPNMDRDIYNQPSISTGFIDYLVKPFFEALAHLLPKASNFLEHLHDNRKQWQTLKEEAELKKQNEGPNSLASITSSMELDFSQENGRRLSVAAGTVTLPEEYVSKLSQNSLDFDFTSSKSKSHSSSTSKHELATVEEGIDNLMRTIPNVDTSKKEKQLTKLKKKPKAWESDKEYFQSLLMKNLHLTSDDASHINSKKSKSTKKTFQKSIAIMELSSALFETEKEYELSPSDEKPYQSLLSAFFPCVAEFLGRYLSCISARVYLVDETKKGKGIVLFSRGGYEQGIDASEAALSVEASGTVFGEVVRQRQLALTTNLVSPSVQQHSLLFPLIPDFPSSLEGSVVGVIELKRQNKFESDELKLLDSLSQVITPKLLIAYQAEQMCE